MRFFNIAITALSAASASGKPIEKQAAKVDDLVGFATGTTGGGSGAGVTVSSCSELTAAAKKGGVIKVKGTLTGCGIVKLTSNTSVLGIGSNAGLTDGGLQIRKVSNVIIRNLKLHRAPRGKDLIDIDASTKIWVDHNDFSSVGITGDKDNSLGTNSTTMYVKSFTILYVCMYVLTNSKWKGSLIGHSDGNAGEDTGKLKVTYHHNSFINVNSRLPSIRFGTGHMYSSCYNGGTSGVNSRMGAQVLVEQSSFTNTRRSIVTNLDSKEEGFANEVGNVYANSPTQITKKGAWKPSYSYTTDPAASVCSIVAKSAGVGVVTF